MSGVHADKTVWERERAFLERERQEKPESFKADPEARKTILPAIGITALDLDLPTGYIRYSPLDFLVEEIAAENDVVEIAAGPQRKTSASQDTGTIYADLVKIAISTIDAVQRLNDALHVEPDQLRYAGIKDAVAITAQRISLRGVSLEAVLNASVPNIILKNVHEGKGALTVGALKGNRFTLFARVKPDFDPVAFSNRLSDIHRHGVINYYGPQRFGTPRYLTHVCGLHLMRGDYDQLFRTAFCGASPTELPYYAGLRARAEAVYGDWNAMRQVFETLPYSFRNEIAMLQALEAGGPNAAVKAIQAVPQQANLWALAYSSYLANHQLSEWGHDHQHMPEKLPLLLSMDPRARQAYLPALKAHGTERYLDAVRPFRFITMSRSAEIATRVFPAMRGVKHVSEAGGVAISFELPKAAYATTVLMHLFDAITESPIPDWVRTEEVDTKELLGLGSMAEIKKAFRQELDIMAAMRQNQFGEAEGS